MGWGGRLFEAGRLLTFSAFKMGAYSRWALIRGWALIRINTVDQNKNHNRSIDKLRNLGNERRYMYKDPRQESGQRNISYIRGIRRNVLPKLKEICMETLCWSSPG